MTSVSAVAALALGGLVTASAASAAPSFLDVPEGAQFATEIAWLADEGITTGYADGSFRPYDAINRDAMAAFMYRLAGSPEFAVPGTSPFTDVKPTTKFYKEILWLASTGVTTGYADGTFRPRDAVNRDAMAAFMYRLAGSPEFSAPQTSPFSDVTPSTKFYSEISWLAAEGVSTGWSSDSTYRPHWNIARNAMAAFMYRFDQGVGVGVELPAIPEPTPEPTPTPEPDPEPSQEPGPADPAPGARDEATGAASIDRDFDEEGWTTYDEPTSGTIYYVSSSTGSDSNDGLTPETAFETVRKAFDRYSRNGEYNDYILFKRGDTFPTDGLGWGRYGGKSEDERFVISSYGDSTERPVIALSKGVTVLGEVDHSSIVGIDFYFVNADPASPTFDRQATGTGLSFYGNTQDLLIEDVRVRYGHLNMQSAGGPDEAYMDNITVRRSTIAHSWNAKQWADNPCVSGKTQGMYIYRIRNLTVEDSTFFHNGWGQDLPGYGCANMFNHNIYAHGIWDSTISGNTFLHGSSMGIKLSAFGEDENRKEGKVPTPIENVVIENNFFSDSELGISMGGNGHDLYRFRDNTVRGNVFSEMGSDNATDREFQWGVEVRDNDGAVIEDNLFVSSPWYSNVYAVNLASNSNRDISVANNVIYDIPNNNVVVSDTADYANVSVTGNTMVQTDAVTEVHVWQPCLVSVASRNLDETTFSDNQYSSPRSDWFCAEGERHGLDWWKSNHEASASEFTGSFVDPDRTLTTYGQSLGFKSEADIEAALVENSRLNWNPDYVGGAIVDYIKEGFEVE